MTGRDLPPETVAALERAVARLPTEWRRLRRSRWTLDGSHRPGASLPVVLVHPGLGIALLDLAPGEAPGAAAALRARLAAAGFGQRFAGHLPVVHRVLTPAHLGRLPDILDYAFAWEEPLGLPPGRAWADLAERLLEEADPAAEDLPSRLAAIPLNPGGLPSPVAWRGVPGWLLLAGLLVLAFGAGLLAWPEAGPAWRRALLMPEHPPRGLAASVGAPGLRAILPDAGALPADVRRGAPRPPALPMEGPAADGRAPPGWKGDAL